MTLFNFNPLAKASTPLFTRLLMQHSTRNYWPLTPLALAIVLEQLELPGRRSKLQLSGMQPGCSVLLCDETQQCQWFTLVYHLSGKSSAAEVPLLSPLGIALIGKNAGDEVKYLIAGRQSIFTIAEIIRVRLQPGNPEQ